MGTKASALRGPRALRPPRRPLRATRGASSRWSRRPPAPRALGAGPGSEVRRKLGPEGSVDTRNVRVQDVDIQTSEMFPDLDSRVSQEWPECLIGAYFGSTSLVRVLPRCSSGRDVLTLLLVRAILENGKSSDGSHISLRVVRTKTTHSRLKTLPKAYLSR